MHGAGTARGGRRRAAPGSGAGCRNQPRAVQPGQRHQRLCGDGEQHSRPHTCARGFPQQPLSPLALYPLLSWGLSRPSAAHPLLFMRLLMHCHVVPSSAREGSLLTACACTKLSNSSLEGDLSDHLRLT